MNTLTRIKKANFAVAILSRDTWNKLSTRSLVPEAYHSRLQESTPYSLARATIYGIGFATGYEIPGMAQFQNKIQTIWSVFGLLAIAGIDSYSRD